MGTCCSAKYQSQDELVLSESHLHHAGSVGSFPDLDRFIRMRSLKVGPDVFVRINAGMIHEFYTFDELLGDGGFAKVFKATHRATGLPRAIKALKKSTVKEEMQGQLLEEAEILKSLDHPGIAKIYEFYEDSLRYYIVSEFCAGGELFDRITAMRAFTEQMAAGYMREILSVVVYCHTKHIIHRDLKPENILFDSEEEDAKIKVIDFGCAIKYNPSEKLSQKLGTPFYIAPEVLEQNYDEKCDVWSCGVILYILLCGYPPFSGVTESDTIGLILEADLEFDDEEWKDISDGAKSLIKKMLTRDPRARISALEALNDPWITSNVNDKPLNEATIRNLHSFRANSRFQQAIMAFIASEIMGQAEKNELLATFQKFDKDKNGRLSKEEVMQGYKEVLGGNLTEQEIELMFEEIDSNNSGEIDFNEFVVAAATVEKLLSEKHIEQAFKLFDEDGNGYITRQELGKVMGGVTLDDKRWNKILEEVDEDGDGQISKSEFVNLMTRVKEGRSGAWSKTSLDDVTLPTKTHLESRILV